MNIHTLKTLFISILFSLASTISAGSAEPNDKPQQWWKKFKVEVVKEDLFKKKFLQKEVNETEKSSSSLKKWAIRPSFGLFDPNISQWNSYYEDNNVVNFGLESNYYLTENWSLNFGLNHIEASGKGSLGLNGATGADIDATFNPYHLGFQFEQINKKYNFFRPFAGLGYIYTQYKLDNSSGSDIKGHADGYYASLGAYFNFYHIKALQNVRINQYKNLYWTLEARKSWVDAGQFDIGGLNYSFGLSVRF